MAPDARPHDDEVQVSALSPQAPRVWRLWTQDSRVLVAFVTLVVIVATVIVSISLRARPAQAEPATCSGALLATIFSELPTIGMQLSPTSDVVLVSEQSALVVANKQMSARVLAHTTCLAARVLRVQAPPQPAMTINEDVWAIAYHVPGNKNTSSTFTGFPIDVWAFVDATNSRYLSGSIALTPS